MEKIYLQLDYATIILYNLTSTWIQPKTTSAGYMLCYEDDKYSRGVIYRSCNKELLVKIQDKIMNDVNSGKTKIKCITKNINWNQR